MARTHPSNARGTSDKKQSMKQEYKEEIEEVDRELRIMK